MFCHKCGAKNNLNAKSCVSCGESFVSGEVSQGEAKIDLHKNPIVIKFKDYVGKFSFNEKMIFHICLAGIVLVYALFYFLLPFSSLELGNKYLRGFVSAFFYPPRNYFIGFLVIILLLQAFTILTGKLKRELFAVLVLIISPLIFVTSLFLSYINIYSDFFKKGNIDSISFQKYILNNSDKILGYDAYYLGDGKEEKQFSVISENYFENGALDEKISLTLFYILLVFMFVLPFSLSYFAIKELEILYKKNNS